MDVEKFIKGGKYRIDGVYTEDVTFRSIQAFFGNTANAEKINKVFQLADQTKQAWKYLDLEIDAVYKIIELVNGISVLNTYASTDDSFKEVFEKLYDIIPAEETKMREAIEDYINFSDNAILMTKEFVESVIETVSEIGFDVAMTFVGKGYVELLSGTICEWIGSITLSNGATIASTPFFATVQATLGTVAGAVAVELCLLDILCNSTGKAEEMGKIVAMSEYTPYIVETMKYYESNLKTEKSNYSVELFENAFAIHKASQVYVVDHTIKALQIKKDAIIEKLFNREGEYEKIIADTLSVKSQLKDMVCHINDTTSSIVKRTKVVAVKCPVDVYIYDENGNNVVRIINNELKCCTDGIEVCISESEKYICLSNTNEYQIIIRATDTGEMDYIIFEYNENIDNVRELSYNNISLYDGQSFRGEIDSLNFASSDNYNLTTDTGDIYADSDEYTLSEDHKYTLTIINATCTEYGKRIYNCICGDSHFKTIMPQGHSYGEWFISVPASCEESGVKKRECIKCRNQESVEIPKVDHDYKSNIIQPNCIDCGYTLHCCALCGDTYISDEKTALGHAMSGFIVVTKPSCTDTGTEKSTCSACDYSETKSISATGHKYVDGTCSKCSDSKAANCSHICHKNNFIWKILRFFFKLFKIQSVCECGVKHY